MYSELKNSDDPDVVYDIRSDSELLSNIAAASLSQGRMGVVMTYGIVGTAEWWEAVKNGIIDVLTFVGVIVRVDGGPMGDTASVRIEGSGGEIMSWLAWDGFKTELIGRTIKVIYSPVEPKFPPRPGYLVKVLLQVQLVDKADSDRTIPARFLD